ncbi:MAG: hypothetical protein ACUVUU_00810 [bacterium]
MPGKQKSACPSISLAKLLNMSNEYKSTKAIALETKSKKSLHRKDKRCKKIPDPARGDALEKEVIRRRIKGLPAKIVDRLRR